MLTSRRVEADSFGMADPYGPSKLLELQRNFQHRLAVDRKKKLEAIDNARRVLEKQKTRGMQSVRAYREGSLGRPRQLSTLRTSRAPERRETAGFNRDSSISRENRGSVREMLARRRAEAEAQSKGQRSLSAKAAPVLPPVGSPRSRASSGRSAHNEVAPASVPRNVRYGEVRPISAATEKSVAAPNDDEMGTNEPPTHDYGGDSGVEGEAEAVPVAVAPRRLSKREKAEAERKARQEERQRALEARKAKRDAIHADRKAEKARREEQLKREREEQQAADAAGPASPTAEKRPSGLAPEPAPWQSGDVNSVMSVGGRVVIDDERHVQRLESQHDLLSDTRSHTSHVSARSMARSVDDYSRDPSQTEVDEGRDASSQFTEPDEYVPMSDSAETPPPPEAPGMNLAERKRLLKALRVQGGVRKRARADLRVGYKEVVAQEDRVLAHMDDGSRDEHDIRKQHEVLEEARSMLPIYEAKFSEADAKLRDALNDAVGLEEDVEFATAMAEFNERPPAAPALRDIPLPAKHTAKPPAEPRSSSQRQRKPKVSHPPPVITSQDEEAPAEAPQPQALPVDEIPVAGATSAAVPAEALGPDAAAPTNLQVSPCGVCGRKFATDRLARHQAVCKKAAVAAKKRKTFDTKKARVQGTEAAQFVGKTDDARYEAAKKKKAAWKAKSEAFRAAMRAAKDPNAGPPPPSDTSHLIPCDHCGRKFSDSAHEKHVQRCQEKSKQPKVVPKGRQRTKYDPRAAARK